VRIPNFAVRKRLVRAPATASRPGENRGENGAEFLPDPARSFPLLPDGFPVKSRTSASVNAFRAGALWPPKPGVAGSIPAGRAILHGFGENFPLDSGNSRAFAQELPETRGDQELPET